MGDKQQWVAGVHAVRSALKFGRERINEIIYDATRKDRRLSAVLDDAKKLGIPLTASDKKTVEKLAGSANHQGVVISTQDRKSVV